MFINEISYTIELKFGRLYLTLITIKQNAGSNYEKKG